MKGILRFFAFLLVFILGFLSCIWAVAFGGYLAYKGLNYNRFVGWGIAPDDTSAYLRPGAAVDLRTMTPEGVYLEIMHLIDTRSTLTIDDLIDRYGLILPDEVYDVIPDAAKDLPLDELFSETGLDYILDNTTLDYLYQFIPDDLLSEAAREALAGKTFRQVVALDLTGLLRDVKLGYLVGVNYVKDAEGNYRISYATPGSPTLFELFGSLDLGHALEALTGSENVLAVISEDLGNVLLAEIAGIFTETEGTLIGDIVGETSLADIIKHDENGNWWIDPYDLVNGLSVGKLLGYTPIYLDGDEDRGIIIGWKQGDSVVEGPLEGLAFIVIDGVGGSDFDPISLLDECMFGYFVNQRPVFDADGEIVGWTAPGGGKVEPVFRRLVNMTLGEVLSDGLSTDTIFGDMKVGEFLDYTYDDVADAWIKDGEKATGITAMIADEKVVDLLNGDLDLDNLLGDGKVGELIGLTFDETLGIWVDENGLEADAILAAIADVDVEDFLSGDFEIDDVVGDTAIGELLGWTYDEATGKWLDGEEPAEGIMASFAALTVTDLKNSATVTATVDGILLADVLGYSKSGDVWYDGTSAVSGILAALADLTVGELTGDDGINAIKLGRILGWTYDSGAAAWLDAGSPAEGLLAELADLTVADFTDKQVLIDTFKELELAEALGYAFIDGEWYTDETGTTPVTGILKTLLDVKVGELEGAVDDLTVADFLGYVKSGDAWYDDTTLVTGIRAVFAGKKVSELEDAIDNLTLADILGYTKSGDVWYDGANEVTGILAALAETTAEGLGDAIDALQIGTIAGWDYDEATSTWYDGANPASGVLKAFASLTVNEMTDGATVSAKIQTLTIAEVMGYTYSGGKWYTDASCTTEVTGILAAIADSAIGNLQNAVDNVKIGDIFDAASFDSGFLKLLGPDVKVIDLEDAIDNIFDSATIADLRAAGIIDITNADIAKINAALAVQKGSALTDSEKCENMTINGFIPAIISLIPSV